MITLQVEIGSHDSHVSDIYLSVVESWADSSLFQSHSTVISTDPYRHSRPNREVCGEKEEKKKSDTRKKTRKDYRPLLWVCGCIVAVIVTSCDTRIISGMPMRSHITHTCLNRDPEEQVAYNREHQ